MENSGELAKHILSQYLHLRVLVTKSHHASIDRSYIPIIEYWLLLRVFYEGYANTQHQPPTYKFFVISSLSRNKWSLFENIRRYLLIIIILFWDCPLFVNYSYSTFAWSVIR